MPEEDLRRKLDELARRLDRLESHLNLPPMAAKPEVPRPIPPEPEREEPAPEPGPAPPVHPPITPPPVHSPAAPPARDATRPPGHLQYESPKRDRRNLEFTIGARLAAWAAAILIVLGAAFLIKLGIDSGWWGRIPATLRCLLIAAFGGALIGGGELALRRISPFASVGLFAAGLGVLYLDAFGSFAVLDIVSREGAFILMAIVALGGFGITLRTRFRTIGVLSLIAGYATPLLLSGIGGHDLELLTYLTALLAIALGLAAAQPRPFRVLRYLAFGGQSLIALLWMIDSGSSTWQMAIVFMSLWWTMVLGEAVFAALRRHASTGNALITMLATAAYVTAGCWLLAGGPPTGPDWLGLFTVAVAVLGASAALLFGPGLEVLREPPTQAMARLAVALWAQSGVLLIVAVALQFDDYGQSIGWLAIALASIETGRRLRSRGLDTFGLIVGALAVVRIVLVDSWAVAGLRTELTAFGGLSVNGWLLLALLAIAGAFIAAFRLRASFREGWRSVPVLLASTGALLWLGATTAQFDRLWDTTAWLAAAVIMLALHRYGTRVRLLELSLVVLAATAGKWLAADSLGFGFAGSGDDASITPWINGNLALALALSGAAVWAGRVLTARDTSAGTGERRAGSIVLLGAALLLLVALSLEIRRSVEQLAALDALAEAYTPDVLQALGYIALWSLGALGLIAAGFRSRATRLFNAGWFILTLGGLVWLAYPTLGQRIAHGPLDALPFLNLQFGIGALLILLLGLAIALHHRALRDEDDHDALPLLSWHVAAGWPLLGLLGLWMGSLEIDRMLSHDFMAAQAGLSVYWSLYGVALVSLGFARRAAAARYAGLALLAFTVGKVLLVDLSTVDRIWRVASFLASGLLLVGTSLLYSRLTPSLLAATDQSASTEDA